MKGAKNMGWAKYEEDNYEALTDRWTAGNLFTFSAIYGETTILTYTEETLHHVVTTRKEMRSQNEANIV